MCRRPDRGASGRTAKDKVRGKGEGKATTLEKTIVYGERREQGQRRQRQWRGDLPLLPQLQQGRRLLLLPPAAHPEQAAPAAGAQPQELAVEEGQDAVFTITVTGTSPDYQWQRDGGDISGANDSMKRKIE